MLNVIKVKQYGLKWFLRRCVRELVRPTTPWGQYFKPLSSVFYTVISKPGNAAYAYFKRESCDEHTLYFFYDLEVEPITYDFIWALCVANAKRKELGLSFLQVVLVPGDHNGLRKELSAYEQVVSHDARVWRIDAIILPGIRLLKDLCGITLCTTREQAALIRQKAKFVYPPRYNVTFPTTYEPELAVMYKQDVLSLSADNQAKRYVAQWLSDHAKNKKIIVITLRQYAYTPERNSQIEAWARFARTLNKQDYFVVFVADVEQAMHSVPEPLQLFTFFHPACWNLPLRMALYEAAYLNLGVNTGPMSLCWFSASCRYITFKIAVKNVPEIPLNMITDKGIFPDTNPLFSGPFQKWVWKDDDYEVILEEFRLMCEAMA